MSTESSVRHEESRTSYQHIEIATCQDLDKADKLAAFRERFRLPENLIYLDGNSLGPLPKATPARIAEVGDVTLAPLAGSLLVQSFGCHIAWDSIKCAACSHTGTEVPSDTRQIGCSECLITGLRGASCGDLQLLQKQQETFMACACTWLKWELQSCTMQLDS